MVQRVVLDTSIVIAAMRSEFGASRQLVMAAFRRHYVLLMSVPLALEYEAVMTRKTHLEAAGVGRAEAIKLLDGLIALAEPVELRARPLPRLGDPDDEMVQHTAIEGGAHMIATFNVRHFRAARPRYAIDVYRPAGAVAALEI